MSLTFTCGAAQAQPLTCILCSGLYLICYYKEMHALAQKKLSRWEKPTTNQNLYQKP